MLGVLFSTLLAVACINFKADQTIVGTAMNLLGVAAATVIVKAHQHRRQPRRCVRDHPVHRAEKGASRVQIGAFEGNWFMVIAVIALIAGLRRRSTRPASACA